MNHETLQQNGTSNGAHDANAVTPPRITNRRIQVSVTKGWVRVFTKTEIGGWESTYFQVESFLGASVAQGECRTLRINLKERTEELSYSGTLAEAEVIIRRLANLKTAKERKRRSTIADNRAAIGDIYRNVDPNSAEPEFLALSIFDALAEFIPRVAANPMLARGFVASVFTRARRGIANTDNRLPSAGEVEDALLELLPKLVHGR